jgi:hypothetical protein
LFESAILFPDVSAFAAVDAHSASAETIAAAILMGFLLLIVRPAVAPVRLGRGLPLDKLAIAQSAPKVQHFLSESKRSG